MQTTWVETPATTTDLDSQAVLGHLHKHGVLDLAKQLMDEDAQGVERPTVSFDEARAILKDACA